jgi:hypothetical protein
MNKDLGLSSYIFGLGAGAFGWLKDYTGNFIGGLYALAAFGVLAAIVAAPSREWLFTA